MRLDSGAGVRENGDGDEGSDCRGKKKEEKNRKKSSTRKISKDIFISLMKIDWKSNCISSRGLCSPGSIRDKLSSHPTPLFILTNQEIICH